MYNVVSPFSFDDYSRSNEVSHFLVNKLRGDDVGISKAFGMVLRKHRRAANLSQEKLALQCDLDRTYIGMLERAERQLSLTTIFFICEALKLELHLLIKEVEILINNKRKRWYIMVS